MRVDLIFLTVMFALRSEEAFIAATVTPERRREMAFRSVTAELATALHVPQSTMERRVSEAWALATELPATLGAMRNGQITPPARLGHRRGDHPTSMTTPFCAPGSTSTSR